MSENKSNTPTTVIQVKTRESFPRRLLRALITAVVILLLFLVFIIAFTQTGWFRDIVASQIESFVASKTNGTLTIGNIEGDFITGFTIQNANLRLKSDNSEIVSSKEIYLRYSLWKLLQGNSLPVTTVELRSPNINFSRRAGDSLWNYEHLALATTETGKPAHFTMTIDVQNFRIYDGTLNWHDYYQIPDTVTNTAIDWRNVRAQHIDLDMRAYIQGEKIQRAQINHLSFVTHDKGNHPFRLYHLEALANHNDLHLEISGLHLISDGSDIRLSALIDPFTVIGDQPLSSLEHSEAKLQITAHAVSEKELKQFLPDLGFLDGNPSLDIAAAGEFGALKISKGALGFHNDGNIAFAGELRNLHDPKHLFLDIALKGHNLSNQTLKDYVPGLGIEDISRFGTINIEKLTYTGYTTNFISNFDVKSAAGNATGKAALDFRNKELAYNVNIGTKNINLGQIFSDTGLKSNLNSTFTMKGRGTNPKTMQASFQLDGAGTTAFKNYQLEQLHIGGTIVGAKLQLENTAISLHQGASLSSNYAMIDFSEKDPIFDLDITTKDFPITDFVSSFPAGSKVSVEANLSGKGVSPNSIAGSIHAQVSGLMLKGKPSPDINFSATLERDETAQHGRVDIITSPLADLTFKGTYNIETIGQILASHAKLLAAALEDRKLSETISNIPMVRNCDSIHMMYAINVKDLHPAAPFYPGLIVLGSGKIIGAVSGCENGEIAVRDSGNIHNFYTRERAEPSSSAIRLRDIRFVFTANHITNNENNLLKLMNADLTIHSDSTERIRGIYFDKPEIIASVEGGNVQYTVNTTVAKNLGVYLAGKGDISNPDLIFRPDSLSLAFNKNFVWHSVRNPNITIGRDGIIEMDTLELIKPKLGYDPENTFAQRLELGLKIKGDSIYYAYLETPQLDLGDIPKFFSGWYSVPELNNMSGRISRMNARMNGSLYRPMISSDILLRNVTYHDVTIDSGRIDLQYKNYTLSGSAAFHVDTAAFAIENLRQERENIIVSGKNAFHLYIDSLPVLFALKKDSRYGIDSTLIEKRELSIRAHGDNYPLDMFSPFIPVIAHLHGLAEIALSVNGTLQNIIYNGAVDIPHASFLFPTTNLTYDFSGKLSLSNDRMELQDIHLANLPADDPSGKAILNGSFDFKGFAVQKFELTLVTDRLKVLSDASRETMKSIYGPLIIRTEGMPLLFGGTLARPKLDGDISVIEGYLTIPQTETSTAILLNDGITYRIKKEEAVDTSHHAVPDTLRTLVNKIAGKTPEPTEYNDTAFAHEIGAIVPASAPPPDLTQAQLSFAERMLYDLRVSVPGNLWFDIKLNKAYGLITQEVNAEVRSSGNISIERSDPGEKINMNATITLTDKSTYKFFNKEFSPVTGSLIFINDLDNPSLNIAAEYTGIHKMPVGTDETIKIKLLVTGTSNDPRLNFELYRKGPQGDFIKDSRPQDLVQQDVFSYLTYGTFASDVPLPNQNNLGNAGYALASQAASTELNSVLGMTPLKDYVKSVGIDYGTQLQKIKASLSYKGITLTPGFIYNSGSFMGTSVTFEVPFSTVFPSVDIVRNARFVGEYHSANLADPSAQEGLIQQPLFLGRLLYPISP